MHQLSPGFLPSQILCFQFHLCWPVMSQKLPTRGHVTSWHVSLLSTSFAHTRWVLSWIHLWSPYLEPKLFLYHYMTIIFHLIVKIKFIWQLRKSSKFMRSVPRFYRNLIWKWPEALDSWLVYSLETKTRN